MTKTARTLATMRAAIAELPTGHRLPAERELAANFEVSRPTLRAALAVLTAEGTLTVSRGSKGGYTVAERAACEPATVTVPAEGTDRHADREHPTDYRVTVVGGRAVACTCKHWHYRGEVCKHMRSVSPTGPR